MDLEDLTVKLQNWFRQDYEAQSDWRAAAREDYEFYNGHQWANKDIATLQNQKRPVMTFNRIAPIINAVVGSERNNKREIRFIPRHVGEAAADEVLSNAAQWFMDEADADYENSSAFSDAVICGMGWVETRIDFENSPQGNPYVARLDPLKMVWAHNSHKANLINAERLWYVDKKPVEEAKLMFPEVAVEDLDANWFGLENISEDSKDVVTLIECRWFEREYFYLTQTGELSAEEYKADSNIKATRLTRKVAKRAFLGRRVLAEPDTPLAPKGSLGWECITAYIDKTKHQFYGLVRSLKDAQRWSNKFFSQIMFIMNAQAKGGIMAERGAFDDDRQAEESWARADNITWLKQGGTMRIVPKPAPSFPTGFFQLFEECKQSFSSISGLSPEFIGTREVNQAGILENTRKQSSLNLLAEIFDNLRRYRKRQGLIILHLLQKYLNDGRLMRIISQDKIQYLPLTAQILQNQEYDVIVDDAPTSPNEKERNFAIIQQLMPILQQYMTPEMGLELLNYSPLPASLVEKFKNIYGNRQQQPNEPSPQMQKHEAELAKINAQTQAITQKAAIDMQTTMHKAQLDLQKQIMENEAQSQRTAAEQERNRVLSEKNQIELLNK